MSGILVVVLPVFGLLGLGYAAARFGLLSYQAGEGLSEFVFTFCIPPLIFRTMATASLPDSQPWGYWGAYFLGLALSWALAMAIGRAVFKLDARENVVAGFAAGQSNTALVGIPLLLEAFGDAGAVPLFLLLAVHLPITMTSATLLMEGPHGLHPLALAKRLLLNPILLGLMAGLAFRGLGAPYGGALRVIVDYLANAAVPCALVAMGLALRRYGLQADVKLTATIAALKLFVHPAAVYVLAHKVFTMPPVWSGVAVLFAAMPSGVNAYLFAERYRTGVALSSSAIALSTALSVASAAFWLWMLGIGGN
jgi:malonate transporter